MTTCRFHLQPGRSHGREWNYIAERACWLGGKVTTVKRVARVFRDLTPLLRDKRNRSLVHRPTVSQLPVAEIRRLQTVQHIFIIAVVIIGFTQTLRKKVKVAHTRLPSVGFRSWSRFLAVSLQVTWVLRARKQLNASLAVLNAFAIGWPVIAWS